MISYPEIANCWGEGLLFLSACCSGCPNQCQGKNASCAHGLRMVLRSKESSACAISNHERYHPPPLLCILFCESESYQVVIVQKHVPALVLPARALQTHPQESPRKSASSAGRQRIAFESTSLSKCCAPPLALCDVSVQKSSACIAFHTRSIHECYHQPSTGQ